MHTTGGYLTYVAHDHAVRFRPARMTTCTGARRTSAGSRAIQLYRVRPALRWAAPRSCSRACPAIRQAGPLLADRRDKFKVNTFLYRAHGHPRADARGRRTGPSKLRHVQPAHPRFGGRAHQPRGLDVVPRATSAAGSLPIVDTWWQTETGGIMISADALRHPAQARLGHARPARYRRGQDRATPKGTPVPVPTRAATWWYDKPWPGMLRGVFKQPRALQVHVFRRASRACLRVRRRRAHATRTDTSGSWAAWTT